jgi:transcriptional regulator with XRE-family HTH domain
VELKGAAVLSSYLAARKMTASDLARGQDFTDEAVRQWLRGKNKPRVATAAIVDELLEADGVILEAFGYDVVTVPAEQSHGARIAALEAQVAALIDVVRRLDQALDDAPTPRPGGSPRSHRR